jgi:2-phosphoglycerate kinase
MDASQRPIVLLAGAAGIGKTRAAAALAQHLRAQIVRTDDLATAARAMTDPQQQPALHFWATHPEAIGWPAKRIMRLQIDFSTALAAAIEAVVCQRTGHARY